MRVMISGGGTGGHVYPALAVVQTLNNSDPVLWVGSRGGMEKSLVEKAGLPFEAVSAAGLRGKNPVAAAVSAAKLAQGYRQSNRLLQQFKPDVLFVTGGYVCVPVTLAAHRAGIPVVIYLPDVQPGQAIKFLSRYATKIAVTASPAQAFFPAGKTVVTGYPVRTELTQIDGETARNAFNLAADRPTVLVFGGSQGARSINNAITQPDSLAKLLNRAQVIHISGTKDAARMQDIRQALPPEQQQHYHLFSYLHARMAHAFVAADLIICRAGASILGEAPAAGSPAVLVPYPYSGAHQLPNAQYLAEKNAAVIVADADLQQKLMDTILTLLTDFEKRLTMAQAMRKLAKPDAAHAIATVLREVAS